MNDDDGEHKGKDIRHRLHQKESRLSGKCRKDEQQWNVEKSLSGNGNPKCAAVMTDVLHIHAADGIVAKERHRNALDAQDFGGHADDFFIFTE